MKNETIEILSVTRLPGRLDAVQAGNVLGFPAHDLPELVRCNLIKPLGRPMQNSVKYFASVDIQERLNDRAWLSKATDAISGYWKEKNRRKKSKPAVLLIQPIELAQAA